MIVTSFFSITFAGLESGFLPIGRNLLAITIRQLLPGNLDRSMPHDDQRVNIEEILQVLEGLERQTEYDERRFRRGERIVEEFLGEYASSGSVNVIPGGVPGLCKGILVVAIGERDDCEKRILEAAEHLVKCRGTTTQIVFFAAWWNALLWMQHTDAFKHVGVKVYLKLVGSRPLVIL